MKLEPDPTIADRLDALVRAGRWREARAAALAAADAAEPGPLQQLLARLAWLEGDADGARGHLQAALTHGPLPADLEALRGRLLLPVDATQADAVLKCAAHGPAASTRARLAWGDRLASTGRWVDALAVFQSAIEGAESPALRASAALGLIGCGEALDDAVAGEAGMRALVECWPELPDEDARHAVAALVRLARDRARSLVDRLHALSPSRRHRLAAQIAWASGQHADALREAGAAVEADGADDAARRLYAELLLVDDDVERARPVIRALAARDAAPPDLVLALFEATDRVGRDRATLDDVLGLARSHPHHPGLRIAAARALTDVGREQEARTMLGRAMDDDARLRTRLAPLEGVFAESRRAMPALMERVGIGERASLVRVRMGHNALMYQLRSQAGDHFVKVAFPGSRTRAHLEGTARLETALSMVADPSLAVPRAVEVDGALTHPIADGWAVVTHGIDGRSLRRSLGDVRRRMDASHGFEVGRALGALHGMLDTVASTAGTGDGSHGMPWGRPASTEGVRGGFSVASDWASGRRDWRALIEGLTAGLIEARLAHALSLRLEPLFARWRRVLPSLPTGVIHGDFGWHNLLWRADRVVGVVDFDYAATDIRAADLANAIHRTAFDFNRLQRGLSPRPRPDVAAAIVRGYRSTGQPLPVPDFEALDAVARGVRCVYTLSLARADRASLTGAQYGRPARLIEALIRQLDWLDRHDGLGAMLRRAGA